MRAPRPGTRSCRRKSLRQTRDAKDPLSSNKRRMRRRNVTGEKEKLKRGIADPLTKLSPSITAGAISSEAGGEEGEEEEEEEEGPARSHAPHAALQGKPRAEASRTALSQERHAEALRLGASASAVRQGPQIKSQRK